MVPVEFIEAWQRIGWTFGKTMIVFWAVLLPLLGIIYVQMEKKAKVVKRGNTVGNIANQGWFAQGGGWVYFSSNESGHTLCKKRIADPGGTCLSSAAKPRYINVVGDWVYYSAVPGEISLEGDSLLHPERYLYKVKTDGSEETRLNDQNTLCVQVMGEWAYYTSFQFETGEYHLYRIRVDGRKKALLKKNVGMDTCVLNPWVYYGKDDGLYRMKINGRGSKRISEDQARCISVVGEWAYYRKQAGKRGSLHRVKTDGTKGTRLNHDDSCNILVGSGGIYYINGDDGRKIYRVLSDGTGRNRITETRTRVFNILGDKLFYVTEDEEAYWISLQGESAGVQGRFWLVGV